MNLIDRIKEPSTQAGIASLLGSAALFGVPQTTIQAIGQAVSAAFALAAIFMPEKK